MCSKSSSSRNFEKFPFNWSLRLFKKYFENFVKCPGKALLRSFFIANCKAFKFQAPTLPSMLLVLKSFLEKSQEDLRVQLKRIPPWIFCWEYAEIFEAVIFSKHQQSDASESSNSLFQEHQWKPLDGCTGNRREVKLHKK